MRVVEKEAELGSAEFRHKEERVMSGNEASSEADEARFWAMDKDVGRSKARTAVWARGVVTCAGSKTVGVIRMEGMTRD